ncbi:hypothetical protein DI392_17500 [Vibrio albus]|uniref:Helix-turn-helix domain-containing protein n=1 Tax=Vibrio albus TaxID=2200953 RepID=A0A2U3B612_9VIBR|nr:helix-turn-helix domain-containing protein [Vibrio albus]PWI32155.1 hypothetical protein DI392_17500 [Vibrio albus]
MKPHPDFKHIKEMHYRFCDEMTHVRGNDRYLLMTLCRFANHKNQCWRTIPTLSKLMGVSESTIKRSAKNLEQMKIILVCRKRETGSKSHPNIYVLNLPYSYFDEVNLTSTKDVDGVSLTPTTELDQVSVTPATVFDEVTMTSTTPFDGVNLTPIVDNSENNSDTGTVDQVTVTPKQGSICSFDEVNLTPKYKVNINNNINTGGASSKLAPLPSDIFSESLSSDMMNLWTYIKGFVKRRHKRTLPETPSKQDLDAMHWVVEEFSVDPQSKDDCLAMCEFVIDELGDSDKLLNPLVRLKMAAKEHPEGDMRFYERYMGFECG